MIGLLIYIGPGKGVSSDSSWGLLELLAVGAVALVAVLFLVRLQGARRGGDG